VPVGLHKQHRTEDRSDQRRTTTNGPDNPPVVLGALLEERHPREHLSAALECLPCHQCLRDLALGQPTRFLPHLLRHGSRCGLQLR
jgi:hypothetical protein